MARLLSTGLALLALTLATEAASATASSELYMTTAYRYGRFAARIRYGAGEGVISSFFLWKAGSEMSGTFWNELDFEKMHGDCRMQTNPLYGSPVMSKEQVHTMPADMCDAYHDYAFEWTPTYIAWFIDKKEIRRETGAIASAFADNAQAGMEMHFNLWPGDESFGGNFDPKILPVRQFISWVEYSSFKDGAFNVEWREDFNGGTLPSNWAVGSWASPKNLSTHNAQNVTFSQGIAVLSLTSDQGTGFTGNPPADAQAGSSSGGASGSGGASVGGTAGTSAGGNGGAAPKGGSSSAGAGAGGRASGASGSGAGGTSAGGTGALAGSSNGGAAPSSGGVISSTGGSALAGTSGMPSSGSGGAPQNGGSGAPSGNAATANGGNGMPSSGGQGGAIGSGATSAAGTGTPPVKDNGGCALVAAPKRDLSAVGAALLALVALRRRRAR